MPFQPGQSGNPATQFQPGQSGNPNGLPKGTKHISTYIREMLEDENFELKLKDGTLQKIFPMKAIIEVAVKKALDGDSKCMDWLAKYGYGSRLQVDLNTAEPLEKIMRDMLDDPGNRHDNLHDDSEEITSQTST